MFHTAPDSAIEPLIPHRQGPELLFPQPKSESCSLQNAGRSRLKKVAGSARKALGCFRGARGSHLPLLHVGSHLLRLKVEAGAQLTLG